MAFYRAAIGGGGGGGGGSFSEKYSNLTASSSHTITGLTAGKHYLVLVYFISAANMLYNRYDGCTASGGTLTKVSNLTASALHAVGTFYDLVPSGSSATITTAQYNAYMKVFEN